MEIRSFPSKPKPIYGMEGTPVTKGNTWRRKSLFDTEGSKQKDAGSFVLTHADFPQQMRSLSHPHVLAAPLSQQRNCFHAKIVKDVVKKVLHEKIAKRRYDPKACIQLSRDIADDLKENILEMKVPSGFKVVCTCIITERLKPHFFLESGYAWDDGVTTVERDKFAEYAYRNDHVVAVGTVYIVDCKKVNVSQRQLSRALREGGRIRPAPIPE